MRKPRGVQIRANRLIGPGKCLVGTIDECPPRGEVAQRPTEAAQEPRGSGPLPSTPARARGSSVRATPSLHPPRILKTISLFYRKEDPEKSRLRGRLQLFFLSLVWGFPIVAAGIPFVVDQPLPDRWVLPQPTAATLLPLGAYRSSSSKVRMGTGWMETADSSWRMAMSFT